MARKPSDGKRRLLPRVSGRSYRQFYTKLTLILTSVGLLAVFAGQASAAEAPDQVGPATASAKAILSSAKPLAADKVAALVALATKPAAPESPAKDPNPPQASSPSSDTKVPTVSFEVASAEYVAPAPKPTVVMSTDGGNHFPYGQCTYYVATRRPIPWSGNAGQWYSEAQAYGFATGSTPKPGAIMVTWESSLGHVAYVESVAADGSWTVSEMNYNGGWGTVSYRTIAPGSVPLIGFIY